MCAALVVAIVPHGGRAGLMTLKVPKKTVVIMPAAG